MPSIPTLKQSPKLGVCMRTYYKEDQEIEISSESVKNITETICYIDNGRYPIDCCIIELDTDKKAFTVPLTSEKLTKLLKNA